MEGEGHGAEVWMRGSRGRESRLSRRRTADEVRKPPVANHGGILNHKPHS